MSAPAFHARGRTWRFDPDQIEVTRVVHPIDHMAALDIRRRVFAEEQGAPDIAVSDADDARSLIAVAKVPMQDGSRLTWQPVATGRLTSSASTGSQALIAWVATLPEARGHGAGSALMRYLLAAADAAGVREVVLAAQAPAEVFYLRLGFSPAGPLYDVRGIPHLRMVRRRPV